MRAAKPKLRKITVMLPAELVERATRASRQGLTPTLRQGLEEVIQRDAFERIRAIRGTVKLDVEFYDQLRRNER
jgi:hypothetical protein